MSPWSRLRSTAPGVPSRRRGAGRLALLAALIVVASTILAACSSDFDPSSPCTSDGRKPGAYPELESRIPKAFRGGAPASLDSGRICSTDGLASLKTHGVDELHYAGGVWNTGNQSGVSLATFANASDAPLQSAWVAEYYQTTAKNGKNVDSVESGTYDVAPGIVAQKVDVLNNESYQSVVVWERDGRIEIALIADFIRDIQTKAAHESVVREAVNAWLAADGIRPAETPAPIPTATPPAASGG